MYPCACTHCGLPYSCTHPPTHVTHVSCDDVPRPHRPPAPRPAYLGGDTVDIVVADPLVAAEGVRHLLLLAPHTPPAVAQVLTNLHKHESSVRQDTLEVRYKEYSVSQRTLNDWNKLSDDCFNASSVNMFTNKINSYLAKACYT